MLAQTLRVLFAEDDPGTLDLVRRALSESRDPAFTLDAVRSFAEATAALVRRPRDAILVDLDLPGSHGVDDVARIRRADPTVAIVALAGHADPRVASAATRAGAEEFLVADEITPGSLRRSLIDAISRQRLRNELARRQASYDTLVDNISDIVVKVDRNGIITDVNRALETALGIPRQRLVGTLLGDVGNVIGSPSLEPALLQAFDRVRQDAEPRSLVVDTKRADGTDISIETIGNPVTDPVTGEVVEVIAIGRDVTPYVRAQRAIRSLEELKGEFAGTVAHDLRSPMAVVAMTAESLRTEWAETSDDEKLARIAEIERQIQRMARLVRDVLDLARIEAGEPPGDGNEVDVRELARQVSDELCAAVPDGRRCTVSIPDGLPDALADEGRVRRVLTNLLDNAFNCSAPGMPVVIDGGLREGADELVIEVRDRGKGIAPEDQARVFDRFARAGGSSQGAGLGLAICKALVEGWGGRIWLTSSPGEGSSFFFTVPVATGARSAA